MKSVTVGFSNEVHCSKMPINIIGHRPSSIITNYHQSSSIITDHHQSSSIVMISVKKKPTNIGHQQQSTLGWIGHFEAFKCTSVCLVFKVDKCFWQKFWALTKKLTMLNKYCKPHSCWIAGTDCLNSYILYPPQVDAVYSMPPHSVYYTVQCTVYSVHIYTVYSIPPYT